MFSITPNHWRAFASGLKAQSDLVGKARFVTFAARKAISIVFRHLATATAPPAQVSADFKTLMDAVNRANDLGFVDSMSLNIEIGAGQPTRVNIVIPALDPWIFFGGYRSFMMFNKRLQEAGGRLRFFVTERITGTRAEIEAACRSTFPDIVDVIANCEIVDCTGGKNPKTLGAVDDIFIAYSSSTAVIASNTAKRLSNSPFLFYIQEEEGHFHSHNSVRAYKESIYRRPHAAIFNSEFLAQYFEDNKIGVFAPSAPIKAYTCFRHALDVPRVPTAEEMAARSHKKLLFFARPELHAERNLFELGLVALRRATSLGWFPPNEWSIHAIGCPKYPDLALEGGQKLEFLGKLPLPQYIETIPNYDVGMCLMFAPHPSVPNFEFAAAGMPTVTTEFSNRPAAAMEAVCPNLIPVAAGIEELVAALGLARARAYDYDQRVRQAQFEWPRSWSDSFDDATMQRVFAVMQKTFGERSMRMAFSKQRYQRIVQPTPLRAS